MQYNSCRYIHTVHIQYNRVIGKINWCHNRIVSYGTFFAAIRLLVSALLLPVSPVRGMLRELKIKLDSLES